MSLPTVYVVAATGTQGSAVCRHLRQSNWSVRATVRNIESPQAQALAKIGVVLNSGNWDDEEALTAGLTGCNKLFLALGPNYSNLDDERIWAQRIIALAKKAGVEDVVYSSSISADAPEKRTLLPPSHFLFKSLFIKNVIEGLVQRAGLKHWTIIRPGFFMSNLLAPKARIYSDLFERNAWLTALKPDTKLNLVDPQDIAKFAFAAFNEPERFNGEGIDLVSERLTAVQMMEILADATGRDMKAEFYTDEQVAQAMDTNPFIGSQVFLRDGEKCVDAERVKMWGIGLGSFKEFLVREKDAVSETYAFMMGLTAVQNFLNFKRYSRPPASESEICCSIDGDANAPDTGDRETGRFPLAPSIRPTFGRNTSIATTSTGMSSRIDQETSQLAEFVSGSSSVDLPLSSDEALTTQSAFQTSLGQTTAAASTTTGIVEPEGQTVIFLIQLPDDDRKRSINKREVGGFVGDGSPDTCTFASSFNLAEGQLFKSGNPIYYSGEAYKELESQGLPPSDAITKGFASTGTSLSFQNNELPNGEAGFCQKSDGQVYITFTSAPPGCTSVTLGVYDVSRCQNGKLVGVDDLSSTSSMVITQESSVVSEEATSLSSEAVELSTSNLELTTLQPDLTSSYKTLSSIENIASTTSLEVDVTDSETLFSTEEDVASTTSLEVDDSASESVTSTSEVSSSEPVESTTIADNTFIALSSETSSEGTTTDPVENKTLDTATEISTTADETTFKATTTPEPPTTTVDTCVAGITSVGGSPPLQDRIDDCEEFNVITVSPYTVTETILSKRWEYRIPTGWPTARPTNKQLVRRQDPEATTIFPSETPAYATYCDSAEEYYDACSSAGVTAVTTTLPTPTETETEEEPACRGASMVKRAGEGLGYQFEDDWDVIRMPGWRHF
ncbi:hypothetical protein FOQG_08886 [Fusarium oxysporum f. sp. raphani 54005]|uniref:Uncharacterized protein n=1 Tax=Fusarium oxysporum f. sp. raphani 54005 TaxID=1089458 RepID=X0C9L5_FUSOX|nr:hypothetical protein FOQG_08886 [Fusarium oxysporum f. sp. raphani 54005]